MRMAVLFVFQTYISFVIVVMFLHVEHSIRYVRSFQLSSSSVKRQQRRTFRRYNNNSNINNNKNNNRMIPTNSVNDLFSDHYETNEDKKFITFIRHGCTYMNEYLSGTDQGHLYGSSGFTDVFAPHDHERRYKYHDTKLSPNGVQQVHRLLKKANALPFLTKGNNFFQFQQQQQNCDLIVTSPLTRALQTYDYGIKDHVDKINQYSTRPIPVVAVPEAAERLYLVSDIGRPVTELQIEFPYVDFHSGFHKNEYHSPDKWWYDFTESSSTSTGEPYVEWRPYGGGQQYACYGEPDHEFHNRMLRLYNWLDQRKEKKIAVVCHHGVIEWFLNKSFDNCQYKTILFDSIQTIIESKKYVKTT